jgi:3-oxoacyl-[acyl-carrier protein] reductase
MMLKGKVAIITGGTQGIGKATATAFAREGAAVVIVARNYEKTVEVAGQLSKKYKTDCIGIKTDVSDEESVNNMVKQVLKKYSTVDILVNNAGICKEAMPFENLPIGEWHKMININLLGPVNCTKAIIPIMKKNKSGKIINLSSLAGEVGGITVSPNYSATKAAVSCLTKSLAKYLGPYNINVNAVAPGFIKTAMTANLNQDPEMVPLKRAGEPEEVADVILFLASDMSRYITGATIDVNGGIFMK